MKERDIRDRDALNEYLRIVDKDVKTFFEKRDFVKIRCPACSGNDLRSEFEKSFFQYVSCADCSTLFANPRPRFDILKKFYSDSASSSFWVHKFFGPMAEKRRKRMFKPRAEYAAKVLGEAEGLVIGDIGAGFGLFLEELKNIMPSHRYIAIEPSEEMAEICRRKGLEVRPSALEQAKGLDGAFDALSAFELLEHLYSPEDFLRKAYSMLKGGGRLFLTAPNGMGFDVLVLWERSKSISPPHHINFFNPASLRQLIERVGFEVIEAATPGELDWDIVEGAIRNEGADPGRFWMAFSKGKDESAKRGLQDWISRNGLSSHMRVTARKPLKEKDNV